jgi:hypothetical protein
VEGPNQFIRGHRFVENGQGAECTRPRPKVGRPEAADPENVREHALASQRLENVDTVVLSEAEVEQDRLRLSSDSEREARRAGIGHEDLRCVRGEDPAEE